jgi:hypothetical protein
MEGLKIIVKVYDHLISQIQGDRIRVDLRVKSIIGTVQDDPFDTWIEDNIKKSLPEYEVIHSGSLTTPDLVIRDKRTGIIIGLEIKKLIQKTNGADPRGMTLDYNSCLPCGSALIKVGEETVVIPCFYLFALLSPDSSSIVTLILMDGDFLNYDFNLHKKAKFDNISEYNHGPYGEGSVRHRKMYTYPNPLNYKLKFLHLRKILVAKKYDCEVNKIQENATEMVIREDIYGHQFYYLIIDKTLSKPNDTADKLPEITDVFSFCKMRKERERVASMPYLMPDD